MRPDDRGPRFSVQIIYGSQFLDAAQGIQGEGHLKYALTLPPMVEAQMNFSEQMREADPASLNPLLFGWEDQIRDKR